MKKKFIKRAIPAEISDKGGAYVQFVEKDTVPLDGVIVDAIDGSYCQGRPTLILAAIQGLLKSMARGVATDGHPRQVADYITVYLVVDGEIDLDRGFDPAVNSLKIRARLLNEMEIDITGWALEDVTPGRRPFTLASAYTGATKGMWEIGETGEINGDNVPSTRTGETIRVDWKVEGTDKSGTIPADKVTSNISRIDIAADALAEIASEEYGGKTIVFTVRGNFSSARIAATLKYVAPEPVDPPSLTSVAGENQEPGNISRIEKTHLVGTGLAAATVKLGYTDPRTSEPAEKTVDEADVESRADGEIVLLPSAYDGIAIGGEEMEFTVTNAGGSDSKTCHIAYW